jgi:hypothetical protein
MDISRFKKITNLGSSLLRSPDLIGPYLRYSPAWGCTPVKSGLPWISFGAIDFLNHYIRPDHSVFEYGGGGSTIYFARKARSVLTMESHPDWHRTLTAEIAARGLTNVECELHPISSLHLADFQADTYFQRVCSQTWDIILIDCYCGYSDVRYGETRRFALELSLHQVKPGGLIVIDDSWMFPELLKPRQGWRITDYIAPGPCRYGVTSTAILEKI